MHQTLANCLWKIARSSCPERRRISAGLSVASIRFNRARRARSEGLTADASGSVSLTGWPSLWLLYFFALVQRAWTALRALALRCSGVSLAALAGPPFFPPLRPRAAAAGSFFITAMFIIIRERSRIGEYVSDQVGLEAIRPGAPSRTARAARCNRAPAEGLRR